MIMFFNQIENEDIFFMNIPKIELKLKTWANGLKSEKSILLSSFYLKTQNLIIKYFPY